MMSERRARALSLLLALGVAVVLALAAPTPRPASAAAGPAEWVRVGSGITSGVSGLAPAASGWVLVRDNKLAGQNRVALLSPAYDVTPVTWPGTAPKDLESIAAVPGQASRYVTCTSPGTCFVIAVSGTSMSVLRSFRLPAERVENESFALTRIGQTTVALWADRGSAATPARVFAAVVDTSTWRFGPVVSVRVSVPFPVTAVRPVSDLAVVGDRVVVTSASDPGNNGPFDSAVHDVGKVALRTGRAVLTRQPILTKATYAGHKAEAIACVDGVGLLGSDDENLGGHVVALAC